MCLVVPAFGVGLLLWSSYADLRELREKAPFAEVAGEVVKLDCGNHGNYFVQFSLGDTKITRGVMGAPGRPGCGSAWVGKKTAIWHSASDPSYIALHPIERSES